MADFAKPLIDATGHDPDSLNKAMTLGMVFWNMAICGSNDARDELLNSVMESVADTEEAREEFRGIAQFMVDRHRCMFPEMHERRV